MVFTPFIAKVVDEIVIGSDDEDHVVIPELSEKVILGTEDIQSDTELEMTEMTLTIILKEKTDDILERNDEVLEYSNFPVTGYQEQFENSIT